jgi:iron complex transport system substrate-binding protein
MPWRIGALIAVLAVALSGHAARTAGLPRIASMNVCTDQLLLALADPEQIIGLSRYSRDGWQSAAAGDMKRYPVLSGGAEDLLLLRPDIVVASAFDKRSTRELLKAQGLRVVELAVPRTLAEARQQIREVGEVTGHPDRAVAEIARLDAALAHARAAVAERHFRVLPLSRRGWVAGSDSFVSSLLTEAGLLNAAGDLGFTFGGFASLEGIVSLRPDFIVVSQAGNRASDEGQAFLLHPALQRFYPPAKRIVIPERLTECGGVMLTDALDALTAELKRVGR